MKVLDRPIKYHQAMLHEALERCVWLGQCVRFDCRLSVVQTEALERCMWLGRCVRVDCSLSLSVGQSERKRCTSESSQTRVPLRGSFHCEIRSAESFRRLRGVVCLSQTEPQYSKPNTFTRFRRDTRSFKLRPSTLYLSQDNGPYILTLLQLLLIVSFECTCVSYEYWRPRNRLVQSRA